MTRVRRSRRSRGPAPAAPRGCARPGGRRTLQPHVERGAVDRQLGQPGDRAARKRGVQELPGREQVRVVHELVRASQRRERHPAALEPLGQLGARVAEHLLRDARGQPVARRDALGVVVEPLVRAEILEPELVAEALPVAVGGDADEDLLAVGGGEELVDAPAHARALADLRHRHRRLAGGRVLGQPLAHPEHDGLEEARGDLLPAAGLRPLMEGGQDRDHPVGRRAHVHDRGARAQRLAARPGHEGEPGRHLRELVEEGPRLRRAGEEALEGQVDDARVDSREHVVAEAEALDGAVGEVVDHHVRARDQAQEERPAVGRALQIDRDRALVAVEEVEVGRGARRHAARLVAFARTLHLDHVGAQVGQQQPRRGPRDDVAELEDAHALERKRGGHDAGIVSPPARRRW